MAKQSVATSNTNNVGEMKALVLRLYKKFPHLFKKTSNAHNPKTFFLSLSTTRGKVEEAFRILKLSGNSTDLVGFKKLFSLYRDVKEETATIPNVTPGMPSRNSNNVNYDMLDESLFLFKNEIVDHLNAEEIAREPSIVGAICSDDMESVRFDFGDDYGNRREFVELEKELAFGYAWCIRVSSRARKDSKYRAKDICKLSSQEEMLKEFVKNYLF